MKKYDFAKNYYKCKNKKCNHRTEHSTCVMNMENCKESKSEKINQHQLDELLKNGLFTEEIRTNEV